MNNNYFPFVRFAALILVISAISGCAGRAALRVGAIPDEMLFVNMYAHTSPNVFKSESDLRETSFWNHSMVGRSMLHGGGITLDTPNELFRMVPASVVNVGSPTMVWTTAMLVPDQLPRIQAYDVLEVRMRAQYDGALHFTGTEDAPVVIRIVCEAGDPAYAACVKKLPSLPKYPNLKLVQSGTAYAMHWKEYGLTFTPRYNHDGSVRADALPIPPRKFEVSPSFNEAIELTRQAAEAKRTR